MNDLLKQAVAGGEYASGSDVIRATPREWNHRRAFGRQGPDELTR
jgi:Arc/MetJ-type ribon-helix-helix transcriptional regulator